MPKITDSRFQTTAWAEEEEDTEIPVNHQEEEEEEEGGSEWSGSEGELEGEEEDEEGRMANMEALKPLKSEDISKYQAMIEKTGVCYMSRIPPFMKHTKLRSLLSKYADIGRIYLNPEDSKVAARRKKYKKNKRVNYAEGWIEFLDKKKARHVAAMLNNKNIGGKKRSYYYDDIWNIKYLPKYKWNSLTEQLAYELKVKEQKLKNEISQSKRENKMYLKNVDKAKMIEGMEMKRAKKEGKEGAGSSIATLTSSSEAKKPERKFRQRKIAEEKKIVSIFE